MGDSGEMAPFYRKLFDGYPEQNQVAEKCLFWGTGMAIGFGSASMQNFIRKRPFLAGIQTHIFISGLAVLVLEQARQYNRRRIQQNEAILRHYVMLHPEDFPEPPNRKIADIFEPWNVRR